MVEHSPVERGVVGSSPIFHPKIKLNHLFNLIKYETDLIIKYENDNTILTFFDNPDNIGINGFYTNVSPNFTNKSQKDLFISVYDENNININDKFNNVGCIIICKNVMLYNDYYSSLIYSV